jgi:hypothetical protein
MTPGPLTARKETQNVDRAYKKLVQNQRYTTDRYPLLIALGVLALEERAGTRELHSPRTDGNHRIAASLDRKVDGSAGTVLGQFIAEAFPAITPDQQAAMENELRAKIALSQGIQSINDAYAKLSPLPQKEYSDTEVSAALADPRRVFARIEDSTRLPRDAAIEHVKRDRGAINPYADIVSEVLSILAPSEAILYLSALTTGSKVREWGFDEKFSGDVQVDTGRRSAIRGIVGKLSTFVDTDGVTDDQRRYAYSVLGHVALLTYAQRLDRLTAQSSFGLGDLTGEIVGESRTKYSARDSVDGIAPFAASILRHADMLDLAYINLHKLEEPLHGNNLDRKFLLDLAQAVYFFPKGVRERDVVEEVKNASFAAYKSSTEDYGENLANEFARLALAPNLSEQRSGAIPRKILRQYPLLKRVSDLASVHAGEFSYALGYTVKPRDCGLVSDERVDLAETLREIFSEIKKEETSTHPPPAALTQALRKALSNCAQGIVTIINEESSPAVTQREIRSGLAKIQQGRIFYDPKSQRFYAYCGHAESTNSTETGPFRHTAESTGSPLLLSFSVKNGILGTVDLRMHHDTSQAEDLICSKFIHGLFHDTNVVVADIDSFVSQYRTGDARAAIEPLLDDIKAAHRQIIATPSRSEEFEGLVSELKS